MILYHIGIVYFLNNNFTLVKATKYRQRQNIQKV